MKKFAPMALSLIIVMMCVSPIEVMGQSRRSANSASSTSVQKNSPAKSSAATNNVSTGGSRRSGSSSNMNAANTAAASRSTATKSAPSASSRSISNTRETRNISSGASHNNAAAATRSVGTSTRSSNSSATRSVSASTRSVNAAAANRNGNAGRSVASTANRHDNVASKAGTRTEARVHEGGRAEAPRVNNNPPAARNEPPRDNGRMNNNPPRPHDNGPMVHHEPPRPPRGPGHNPPPPPRPRPPRGSHFRASMIGTLITIAKINALNDAIRRAERAARLATRYSIVVNRNYTPRTYATIVETVRDDINYYYNDGVFYIIGADGDYYVIEPPIGALVEAIPTDYETVIIDDEVFYQVDDTLYRLTIIDGIPYFEVVLNL
ncbi:MAG: hypothetical protein IKN88_07100 [Bacteroidales bacterium]|nr:hypothetical protein [Bacteroidales bacterium]